MLRHARRPVGPRQPQQPGIIPAGLQGLDTEATWSDRQSDGWVDGHGTVGLVAWTHGLVGPCTWRRPSGHVATRRWRETGKWQGLMTPVRMDSQADEHAWCCERQRQRTLLVLTPTRKGQAERPTRKRRIKGLPQHKHKRLYTQSS